MEFNYKFEYLKFIPKNKSYKNKKKFILSKKKFLIFLIFLFFIIFINLQIQINTLSNNIYFFRKIRKLYKIDIYYKICNRGKLLNKKKFKKIENPKISIISPVFNREKYILRFLRSVQNQFFDEIEIIFIDDFSKDNSVKIIEKYQKEDERIILIKHNKNKGTLISRNDGVLKSKGEYIIFPDPDDILTQNILEVCYKIVKLYNIEMIRFNIYMGNKKIFLNNIVQKLESKLIFQPELSKYLFYGLGTIQQIDFNLTNKFIKRLVFIKVLNSLDKYFFYLYLINMEDGIMNYALYRNIKSFYFLKIIGYFYIQNQQSITINYYKNYDETLRSFFIFLKFFFENSKNTKEEKDIGNELIKQFSKGINIWIDYITKDFELYLSIINMYLNCKFISFESKNILKNYKLKILK